MQAAEFVSQVRRRAGLENIDEARDASRATLETLSERLKGNEPEHLAAQLPPEIGQYLKGPRSGSGERFPPDIFFLRVSEREGVDVEAAQAHAQAVMEVVSEAVSAGEMEDVRAQLPPEYQGLIGSARQRGI